MAVQPQRSRMISAIFSRLRSANCWQISTSCLPHRRVGEAVTGALAPAPSFVLCHISHVYDTGASLYFTVVGAQSDDPRAQWATAKDAACRAIVDNGATITHHHAVGKDHRPYLAEEIGEVGVAVLRGIKNAVDPAGIMNPGKLVP